jgi:periplasmic copper chaperone A
VLKWFRGADRPAADMSGLSLSRPWARLDATTPTQAGGFFTVRNAGPADRLVAAASALAERVEIHAIRVVGADIRMRPLPDGLGIPADATIELKPRGYHLLLIGLKARPQEGASLPVTLTFEKAGRREVGLIVGQPGLVGSEILDEERHRR